MESFDPFLNSMSTPTSELFINSIPRQLPQRAPSKLPPTFDPFQNSILPSKPVPPLELPSKRRYPLLANLKIKQQRTAEDTRALEAIKFALGLLEDEFKQRETASQEFPPEISSSQIRASIGKYENEMSTALEKSVCCSCGRFVATADIYQIDDSDDIILSLQCDFDH